MPTLHLLGRYAGCAAWPRDGTPRPQSSSGAPFHVPPAIPPLPSSRCHPFPTSRVPCTPAHAGTGSFSLHTLAPLLHAICHPTCPLLPPAHADPCSSPRSTHMRPAGPCPPQVHCPQLPPPPRHPAHPAYPPTHAPATWARPTTHTCSNDMPPAHLIPTAPSARPQHPHVLRHPGAPVAVPQRAVDHVHQRGQVPHG